MAAEEHSQPDTRWLTAAEASLLVFAAYFFITALLGSLLDARQSLSGWLGISLVPALTLLAGALLVRRSASGLYPVTSRHSWLRIASLGWLMLGLAGGIWIGPTLPERLAPLLANEWAGVWGLLWVGIAAPIIEELFFRGALQPAIERHIGGLAAVLAAALAFGLAHWGIPEIAIISSVGLFAGVAAWGTGHVLPAIALHVGWNFATIAVSGLDYELASGWPMTLLAILGLICLLRARQERNGGVVGP